MKNKIISISLILILIGVVFIGVGIFSGAKRQISVGTNGIKIVEDKETKIEELNIGNIENIELNLRYANLQIEEAEAFGIEILHYENDKILWNLEDGKLKVSQEENSIITSFNFGIFNYRKSSYVKIYMPKNAELNKVNLTVNS